MEYEIIGDNLQRVIAKLSSGEMVYGEAGAMIYMSDNMQMNAKAKGGFLNLAAALRPFMPSGTSGRSSSPLSIGGLLGD